MLATSQLPTATESLPLAALSGFEAGAGRKSKLGIGGEGLQNRPPYMKRSFWSLVAVQIQVLLNDNAAKLMLITLGASVAPEFFPRNPEYAAASAKLIKTILAAIILLPFVLFSPMAGWISDRFSKRNVIVTTLWAQIAIMGLIGGSLTFHHPCRSCDLWSVPAWGSMRDLFASQTGYH